MSLVNRKITNTDITSKGVVAAPDTMTGTAQENKMVFDRLIREVVKTDLNGVIDDLMDASASASLGFQATEDIDEDNIQDAIEFLYENEEAGTAKAIEQALKAEGYAVGKQDGVDVTSGSPYYHNNASYYSSQASNSAVSATTQAGIATSKATEASGSATNASGYANDALGYRNTAEAHKNDASDYKDAAAASALSASGSATAAGNSETNSASKALVSEGYAIGKQNGVDVEEGSEYYHNNAKYFKEQAGEASVGYVSYASPQSIPTSGKLQARTNIDAEDFGNKVTSINSSSSDTQYPSAKAVYDRLELRQPKTDNSLTTTAKTVVGAINEHESDISQLNADKADRVDVHPLINIWDEQWEVGYYDNSGVKTGNSNIRTKNAIEVKGNTDYYFKVPSIVIIYWYDSSMTLISYDSVNNAIKTSPSNAKYLNFYVYDASVTTYNNDISINYPSTYTGYYPSALPKEIAERKDEDFMLAMDGFISPTINGIKNYWDGQYYHRRIARVDLGSLTWLYQSAYTRFMAHIGGIKQPSLTTVAGNAFCLKYTNVPIGHLQSKTIAVDNGTSENIYVRDTDYTDADSFKQAMSGTFLYYELATEQTLNIDANGLRYELLWENASPDSSFAGQHISLIKSNYKFLTVDFGSGGGSELLANVTSFSKKALSLASSKLISRVAQVSASGITFNDGLSYNSYGTDTTDNTKLVPLRIYGVR